jgi:cysteine-rich repeat protein
MRAARALVVNLPFVRAPSAALVIALVVGVAVGGLAPPARAQNVKAHRAAAERALVKERYCQALFLYQKLDEVDPNAEWALLAADAAQFADDRPRALALYKSALSRAPKHPRARTMERSIAALEKQIGKSGNGTACGLPPAECGNGLVETGESCDDGNVQGGDSCPATCTGGTAAVVPMPAPPPVGAPVGGPPVPPAPPPVAPPVSPPPVAPPPGAPPPGAPPASPAPGVPPPATEICTLIKGVKIFQKGEWKSVDFGGTLTIKSRGPQWIIVETSQGEGKIAASALEGACSRDGPVALADAPPPPAPAPAPTPPPEPEPVREPEALTEPEPARDAEPVAPVTEPEPAREPIRDLEPLRDEREPAARAPEVSGGGGGLGGFIMLGIGAALAAGGGATAAWGALPYFDYVSLCRASFGATDCPELAALAADYQRENDEADRAALADDAGRLRTRVNNAAQAWDSGGGGSAIPTGRFVFAGGAATAGLGVALMVGGLIWAIAGGAEPDEEEDE